MSERQWQWYLDGALSPVTEAVARNVAKRWAIFSDGKGMASVLMGQMWDEIDSLRAALTAAQAEVTRKDDALRPFAEAWDAAKSVDWVYSRGEAAVFCRNQVNAGHFEKARAALGPAHGAPEHD